MSAKGLGVKAQAGRTVLYVRLWPFWIEVEQTHVEPLQLGLGLWLTRDTRSLPGSTYPRARIDA